MSTRFDKISELLLEEVAERFNKEPLCIDGLEFGQSFGEMLDRFMVLHIRMWKLEDACGASDNSEEIADLKRKVDYCFKDVRPKLTKAINCFLDAYISKNHAYKFNEENIKLYEGFDNK